ncbi:methylated-DNA-[protein]-cysteine S-methyltransferase [Ruminiclostridium sufflavum DSM 19573]|uniref:Methylated-DNA--protein-cysteine methyltransferase n=1 Tax=Ruminiclostridium sufflavum DSM 19573 TaxID=1121337 RepID=A0A318XLV1_9FIRM|nr:methylated-DNA--[protein]-cysteine S-methyltransferase [Ruminiclostridium sufflavum]PYG86649.1 methylated-DNA-[protein]-cysteine S-methyltransferase [Ruminiclostridium sufflavum DSM 19573]
MKYTAYMKTSMGLLGISETDGFITELFFEKDTQKNAGGQKTPLLEKAERQLTEYLSGNRAAFDLPIAAEGTVFQKIVWDALRKIPYGQTRSYKQIAEMIGKPSASRAVGMANNKNPILILIPCHRVVGADGKLIGYAAGLDIKEKLLELERTKSPQKKI